MGLWRRDERGMRSSYAREHPYLAGETIAGGEFACADCGHRLRKEPGKVTNLPVCPRCQCDRWKPG
ncbi:MAG TPA: hypothetical protein VFH44_05440 [Solirubrobacterales bacterium]|nr:hypothetical protein [Solirubrobacterales bacterium]